MGNLEDVFRCAWNNDARGLNKLIENEGRRHMASYMAEMILTNDINRNHAILMQIDNIMGRLYSVIKENDTVKKEACNMLNRQMGAELSGRKEIHFWDEETSFQLVYRRALEFYFGIEANAAEEDYELLLHQAVSHRKASFCMQFHIECILEKAEEDKEIIALDTDNLRFLIDSCWKLEKGGDRFRTISALLRESIQNAVLKDGRFREDYFITAKKIMECVKRHF